MSARSLFIAFLLVLCVLALPGCGGGSGGGSTGGSMEFTILWPSSGRVIPAAAQSLVITVKSGGQTIATKIIPRPPAGTNTSSVRFDALPAGVVDVTVDAYPNADGTGVIQATGGITVAIINGQTTQATIDPASTVDHLNVSPNPLFTLVQRTVPIVVSPRNASDSVVLVAPSSLMWSSNAENVAKVDANGVVSGIALGDATVQVVDSESGHTAQVMVHVVPPIVISPPQLTLTLGDRALFSAQVTLLSSPNVNWSVLEQNGGTIDSEGDYTAPNQPGVFHVVATSVSDPSLSAQATVTVQSGSGTVNIQ